MVELCLHVASIFSADKHLCRRTHTHIQAHLAGLLIQIISQGLQEYLLFITIDTHARSAHTRYSYTNILKQSPAQITFGRLRVLLSRLAS